MRISDWSSDVCSSDLRPRLGPIAICRPTWAECRSALAWGCAHACGGDSRAPADDAGGHHHRLHSDDVRFRADPRIRALAVRPVRAGGDRELDRAANRPAHDRAVARSADRSEEHTSELQSLMRISYAVFCLKKKNTK